MTTAIDYEQAIARDDKETITELNAKQGPVPRIAEFPNLRVLRLTGNRSITDFSFLAVLPKLETLLMDDLGLSGIPEPVANLQQLSTLFLGKNPVTDFSVLARLPRLVDLGLEDMDLRKVPDEVTRLGDLKVLGLTGNELTSLTAVKSFKKLEELYAANNRIKKLPKELCKLPLRKLHVMHNFPLTGYEVLSDLSELEELSITNSKETSSTPACVFELTKLKELAVYLRWEDKAARIEGIDDIGNLVSLESLKLEGMPIKRLPDGITQLKKLRKLDLRNNKALRDIDALRDLPALEEIDLTSTGVREIGDGFSGLKALRSVTLEYNSPLEKVDGLRDLPRLEFLYLYCKLRVLPDTLGTLTALKTLKLNANAMDVGFLAGLTGLEELLITDCNFDRLPAELTRLERLTIHRDKSGDDSYLAAYPRLRHLSVNQPSFTLPDLPAIETLSVGRIAGSLDLGKLSSLPALAELSIHRSDTLTALPAEVAEAKGVKRATFEFLEKVTDISAIGKMPAIEELELSYFDKLEALPAEWANLTRLKKLDMSNFDALKDMSVVGELPAMEWLRLSCLELIEALPESMARLSNLRYVRLRSNDELKDISVLEKAPSLEQLSVDYCDELRRKSIAAVEDAIAARGGEGAGLEMSYRQFMDSGRYKTLEGKEHQSRTYGFPLWFDTPEVLLDAIEHYSWLDDIRYDEELPENAILTDPDSELKPLAILDLGWEGCDTSHIDSYCEEIFLVDTASARNPVFIWGHDGSPAKIADDFDAFLASLRPFVLDGQDEVEPDDGDAGAGDDKDEGRRYFEYLDDKSTKFWQIVVSGSQHEVTFGKIGTGGTSKVKEFDSPDAAQKSAEKLIASKLKKGYVEQFEK